MTQSKNLVAVFPAAKLDTYRENRDRLSASWNAIIDRSGAALIDLETTTRICNEIDLVLANKLGPQLARQAAGKLFKSYPSGKPASPQDYMEAIAEELECYPAEAVIQAVRQAIRTIKFLPSVAELVELCERFVSEMQNTKCMAERVIKAHEKAEIERRAREAEKARRREEADETAALIRRKTGSNVVSGKLVERVSDVLFRFDIWRYTRIFAALREEKKWACLQVAAIASLIEDQAIEMPNGKLTESDRAMIDEALGAVPCDE